MASGNLYLFINSVYQERILFRFIDKSFILVSLQARSTDKSNDPEYRYWKASDFVFELTIDYL